MTVAEYMKTALTHPRHGFYTTSPAVFGSRGHFTTSPEVSALFGEMVAIWALYEWQRRVPPKIGGPLRIVELGPGRGYLSADVARVLAQFGQKNPTNPDTVSFHLVEISDRLRAIQERTICGDRESTAKTRTAHGQPITWYRSVDELPSTWEPGFTVFLANEYFDALPVHKFVRRQETSEKSTSKNEWREVLVDVTPSGDGLRFIQARHPTPASQYFTSSKDQGVLSSVVGDHYEVCPEALLQSAAIVDRLEKLGGGCMLIIDYGFDASGVQEEGKESPNRDTFRAFREHALADPLENPGTADLTADLDFDAIKREVLKEGTQVFGPVSQEHFLRQMGIGLRVEMLLQSTKESAAREQLLSSVKMLLEDMGRRFKVMSVFAGGDEGSKKETPVGFEK